MNLWFKRILIISAGAIGGYAYWYYIGCMSGACPITSNPYISTGYGALIGLVLSWGQKKSPSLTKQ